MSSLKALSLRDHFIGIKDPRLDRRKRHLLIDIIILSILAVLCGASGWEEIESFGKARLEWLQQYLELPNGVPHHDTFRRVFEKLCPRVFEEHFRQWVTSVLKLFHQEIVSIDGKSMRGSGSKNGEGGLKMLHLVSAFANEQRLVLGQVKTEEKSNEITAIPELLKLLSLKGCIVTLDAMGTQRQIAEQIQVQGADYVLAVKGNQEKLYKALEKTFSYAQGADLERMTYAQHKEVDAGHGRVEARTCTVLPVMYLQAFKSKWKGLKSLIRVESEQTQKKTKEVTRETRYYVSSLEMNAPLALHSVRTHWGIESMHWVLDVVFQEDACTIRSRNGAENFSVLRRLALNLLEQATAVKRTLKRKRYFATLDVKYLEKLLNNQPF